ncbi:MAG: hypothetical protein LBQ36_07225 [Synergistaceae bacterium]|jgi:hypothetical protein|nr:hypothetical protein [Synergistaceae bacterium]
MKKLFAVIVIATVLSCAAIGEASSLASEGGSGVPLALSGDPEDWIAVIVKQDYAQRVLVRLYGKVKASDAPYDVFASVSGIESARTWIGDANGDPCEGDHFDDNGYVIIEGTAPSEAAAGEARVNWVGYSAGGQTLIQAFSDNPIAVKNMSSGEPDARKDTGGCDTGFGGLFTSFVVTAMIAFLRIKKTLSPKTEYR